MSQLQPDYSLTAVAPTIAAAFGLPAPKEAVSPPIDTVCASLGRCERVALIVLDAFGVALWEHARRLTPHFNGLAEQHLLRLESVSPPVTPVCFATLASGAAPQVHQLRDRRDELRAQTVFQVLREAGLTSAVVGQDRSSARLVWSRFADYARVAGSNTDDELLDLCLRVVEQRNPNLLATQLLDIDDAGHAHGPFSARTVEAIGLTDARLARLCSFLGGRGYAVLVTADHGQHDRGPDPTTGAKKGTHNGSTWQDFLVPLTWQVQAP